MHNELVAVTTKPLTEMPHLAKTSDRAFQGLSVPTTSFQGLFQSHRKVAFFCWGVHRAGSDSLRWWYPGPSDEAGRPSGG